VPLLLSDIDVHREQASDTACYFGLDDPATLADMLWQAMQNAPPTVTRDLLPGLDRRVAAFAADFARVVRNTTQTSQVMTVRDSQANVRH